MNCGFRKTFGISLWLVVAALSVAGTGCESKKEGLAKLLASPDHKALVAIAAKVKTLKTGSPCDDVMAQARRAVPLLKRIVPGFATIATAAVDDEPLGSYLGTLNGIRSTMKMSARSYAKDKKAGAKEILSLYCKSVITDLVKVKTGK